MPTKTKPKSQPPKKTEPPKKPNTRKPQLALNKKVSINAPYPNSDPKARRDRISIQYAVKEVARQAGLKYDFTTSLKNTNPICRRFIKPKIRNQSLSKALTLILKPVGLKYKITNGTVVLTR